MTRISFHLDPETQRKLAFLTDYNFVDRHIQLQLLVDQEYRKVKLAQKLLEKKGYAEKHKFHYREFAKEKAD